MTEEERVFFESMIAAGAILAGFCSTFLAFRIEREAQYYRQPALSYEEEKARDVYIGLTHFTSAFLLIILAALSSIIFGFLLPLIALARASTGIISPELIVGGLVGTVVLLTGYFVDEMVHYGILRQHLLEDTREWAEEKLIVLGAVVSAVAGGVLVAILL